ncbi:MAG: AraC family transcriptional regulator, partial [Lachnospiraceae bacterium]|nr:AraC family transcriptional regulator [Lachnospiraceae bacterium]
AKALLQEGASVTEACYRSGFNDYANFIRSFKKVTGVSPGKYR